MGKQRVRWHLKAKHQDVKPKEKIGQHGPTQHLLDAIAVNKTSTSKTPWQCELWKRKGRVRVCVGSCSHLSISWFDMALNDKFGDNPIFSLNQKFEVFWKHTPCWQTHTSDAYRWILYINILEFTYIQKCMVYLFSCCHIRNVHHQTVFSLNKILVYGGIGCHSFEKNENITPRKKNVRYHK